MMDWLADWLKELILLVLVATFLDLLLPSNSMDRYVKLVMGLLIIMAILHPIFQLIDKEINLRDLTLAPEIIGQTSGTQSLEEIQRKKEKLQQTQADLIRKQMENYIKKRVEKSLEKEFAVEVMDVQAKTELNKEQIPILKEISVAVQPKNETTENQLPLRPIEPVAIGEEESQTANATITDSPIAKEMERYLSDYWEIAPDQVRIYWQNGV